MRKARGRLTATAAQRIQRLFDQFAPHLFFLLGRNFGVADDVDDAVTEHSAIGADHFGDRQSRGDLHGGDAGFFQFGCDRSAAASAGASRRGKYDRVDAQPFGFLGHLAPHAPRIRQRIGQTGSGEKLIVQLADGSLLFQLAHDIEGH